MPRGMNQEGRRRLTLAEKLHINERFKNGDKAKDICRDTGVCLSTVYQLGTAARFKWKGLLESHETGGNSVFLRMEQAILAWIKSCSKEEAARLTPDLIKNRAVELYNKFGENTTKGERIRGFRAGSVWFCNFVHNHKLHLTLPHLRDEIKKRGKGSYSSKGISILDRGDGASNSSSSDARSKTSETSDSFISQRDKENDDDDDHFSVNSEDSNPPPQPFPAQDKKSTTKKSSFQNSSSSSRNNKVAKRELEDDHSGLDRKEVELAFADLASGLSRIASVDMNHDRVTRVVMAIQSITRCYSEMLANPARPSPAKRRKK